jgi:hypothetical protein
MKSFVLSFCIILAVVSAGAAVVVNPTSCDDTYRGVFSIAAEVSPPTPGANITISLIADFNSNGVVDGKDGPYKVFPMRDNDPYLILDQASGISHVFPEVPNDTDNRVGWIRLQGVLDCTDGHLPYGQTLVQVDDGSTQQVATMTVSQLPTGIRVSGIVKLDNQTGTGHPAMVVLGYDIEDEDEEVEFRVLTDEHGDFNAQLPKTGLFFGVAVMPGLVTNLEGGGALEFTAASGDNSIPDLSVQSQNIRNIIGRVVGSIDGKGIPFFELNGFSEDNGEEEVAFCFGMTDINGYFSLPAINTGYKWAIESDNFSEIPYIEPGNDMMMENITVDSQDVDVGTIMLTRAITSMFKGRAVDGNSQPIVGLDLGMYDYMVSSWTLTDASGYFYIGVFGGGWYFNVGFRQLQSRGLIKNRTAVPGTIANQQVIDLGDIVFPAGGWIKGNVTGSDTGGGLIPYGNIVVFSENAASRNDLEHAVEYTDWSWDRSSDYYMAGVPYGRYYVAASSDYGLGIPPYDPMYVPTFYPNASVIEKAQLVEVSMGTPTVMANIVMPRGVDVGGLIFDESSALALDGIEVLAINPADYSVVVRSVGRSDYGGSYSLLLPTGNFIIRAVDPSGNYRAEYFASYNVGTSDKTQAFVFSVTAPTGINYTSPINFNLGLRTTVDGDLNDDGSIDYLDLLWMSIAWYSPSANPAHNHLARWADLMGDSDLMVNQRDLLEMIKNTAEQQ